MKYTTALVVILALGPAANVLAAPISQDVGSALSARTESPSQGSSGIPSGGQTQGTGKSANPVTGSSSEGSSGASSGSEGLLDKVEEIIKEVLGGLRKREVIEEVGQLVEDVVGSAAQLLNGDSSSTQSAYNTQSTDPDALPATAPANKGGSSSQSNDSQQSQSSSSTAPIAPSPPSPPSPPAAPSSPSSASSGSSSLSSLFGGSSGSSSLSKLISGRSLLDQPETMPEAGETDPVNTSGATAPLSPNASEMAPNPTELRPQAASSSAPITKQSAPVAVPNLMDTNTNSQDSKMEIQGPNNGTPSNDAVQFTPEEIQSLKNLLQSQSQTQSKDENNDQPSVPGVSSA